MSFVSYEQEWTVTKLSTVLKLIFQVSVLSLTINFLETYDFYSTAFERKYCTFDSTTFLCRFPLLITLSRVLADHLKDKAGIVIYFELLDNVNKSHEKTKTSMNLS